MSLIALVSGVIFIVAGLVVLVLGLTSSLLYALDMTVNSGLMMLIGGFLLLALGGVLRQLVQVARLLHQQQEKGGMKTGPPVSTHGSASLPVHGERPAGSATKTAATTSSATAMAASPTPRVDEHELPPPIRPPAVRQARPKTASRPIPGAPMAAAAAAAMRPRTPSGRPPSSPSSSAEATASGHNVAAASTPVQPTPPSEQSSALPPEKMQNVSSGATGQTEMADTASPRQAAVLQEAASREPVATQMAEGAGLEETAEGASSSQADALQMQGETADVAAGQEETAETARNAAAAEADAAGLGNEESSRSVAEMNAPGSASVVSSGSSEVTAESVSTDESTEQQTAAAAGGQSGTVLYIVRETVIRGRPARFLSDGTIEAELEGEGWLRFEDENHLNEYLDALEAWKRGQQPQ